MSGTAPQRPAHPGVDRARARLHHAVAELCPVSGQTLREELANAITHGTGLALAVAGAAVLITLASVWGGAAQIVGASIFGASMIVLYLASTLYHSTRRIELKQWLRRFDHIGIYVLIAGSYTPFALGPLRDSVGLTLLVVVWTCAVAGTLLKLLRTTNGGWWSTGLYLAMGWMAVFALGPLALQLSETGFALLIGGGLAYTAGTVFYMRESMRYSHAIWHVFVLGGTVCHYGAVLTTLLPGAA